MSDSNIININSFLYEDDSVISLPSFLTENVSNAISTREISSRCTTVYQQCGACETSTQCGTCQHSVQCDICVDVQCSSCVWSCNTTECSSCENNCQSCNVLCNSCMEDMCGNCQWSSCQSCEGCLTCEDCQGSCESCVSCETCEACQSTQCSSCLTQQSCSGTCQTAMSCISCELTQCIPCESAQSCVVGCMSEQTCGISQGCDDIMTESSVCSQGVGLGGGVSSVSPNNGGSFIVTITGLQYPFNTTYYRDIVITKTNYGENTSSISSYITLQKATSSGSVKSVTVPVKNAGYGTYTIYAYVYTNKYYLAGTFNVTVLSSVSSWIWASGTRSAFTSNGFVTQLRYGEWNLFIEKIKEILIFKGLGDETVTTSIISSYSLISSSSTVTLLTLLNKAKASGQGEQITAQQFNTLRYAVDLLSKTGISTVQTGNKVYGSYFLTLESKLNSAL